MKKIMLFLLCIVFSLACRTNKIPIKHNFILYDVKDAVITVPMVEVKEQALYSMLDLIIAINGKCIHVANGESTWFGIWISDKRNDTINFVLSANQYVNFQPIKKISVGAFYYKNSLFVIEKDANFDLFFNYTNKTLDIITYYPNADVYYNPILKKQEFTSFYYTSYLVYNYVNNQFVFKEKRGNCVEYYPIYHKIKKGDTLEKITEKYKVRKETIVTLNNLKGGELPKKGKIRIQ